MYSSRDSWERLVTAVVRKQQIWELCHSHSRSPSISTIASSEDDDDHFNQQFFDSNRWAASTSVSPQAPLQLNNPPSASQVYCQTNLVEPISHGSYFRLIGTEERKRSNNIIRWRISPELEYSL
ncbi:hypothetical protein ACP275_07G104500 [Erythranthe tilingii]